MGMAHLIFLAYRGRPFVNKQIDFVHQSCLLSGMPRLARLDAPGVVHHVIIRGIERRKIFFDTKDRNDMIDRLGDLLPATHTACYAWAFLSNHAHFLFRSGDAGLPTLMRRLLTGYAIRFNRRHRQQPAH